MVAVGTRVGLTVAVGSTVGMAVGVGAGVVNGAVVVSSLPHPANKNREFMNRPGKVKTEQSAAKYRKR